MSHFQNQAAQREWENSFIRRPRRQYRSSALATIFTQLSRRPTYCKPMIRNRNEATIPEKIQVRHLIFSLEKFQLVSSKRSNSEEVPDQCRLPEYKVEYLADLAVHFDRGEIHAKRWLSMSDTEFIDEFTAVRGIGVWTAKMLLILEFRARASRLAF